MIPKARVLKQLDYVRKPWKNGNGETRDVLLLPEGSDHSNFDVRVAFSPIQASGAFSTYEGVERVLTLIEGEKLTLDFDDELIVLGQHESYRFDCERLVSGTPANSDVVVINVMAKTSKWKILDCGLVVRFARKISSDELLILIPLSQNLKFECNGRGYEVQRHETLIVNGLANVYSNESNTSLLAAVLARN